MVSINFNNNAFWGKTTSTNTNVRINADLKQDNVKPKVELDGFVKSNNEVQRLEKETWTNKRGGTITFDRSITDENKKIDVTISNKGGGISFQVKWTLEEIIAHLNDPKEGYPDKIEINP